MLELNLRLNQAKESGANFRDVMNLIATFPNITVLTQLEKQMHTNRPAPSRSFVTITNYDLDDAADSADFAPQTAVYNSTVILQSSRVDKKANRFPKSIGVSDPQRT
jgi:hypothetical protein